MTDIPKGAFVEPYPFQQHLGFEITDWRADFCELRIKTYEALHNRNGILHGGVSATLLDTVMGYACCFSDNKSEDLRVVTLSLNVNYLGQAKTDLLIAKGWRVGGGKKSFFAEGTLSDSAGTIIAKATGVFRRVANAQAINKQN